jgi:type VI secretion system protein ImpH
MASSDRPQPPLIGRVLADARGFEFFPLVRLLRQQAAGAVDPGGPGPARAENLRFRPSLGLGFPASDVESVEPLPPDGSGGPERWQVTVNFMGLYGPSSPMPNHFSESMMWAGSEEQAARDFVDLFHHRMISFVYRAWSKYRHPAVFEPATPDDFTRRMLCLLGIGTRGMEQAAGVSLVPLLRTAGLLADRRRSAAGLEGFLRAHFDVAGLVVEPCVERHAPIPAGQRLRLGRGEARLGRSACLGERIVDRSGAFRIVLGPLGLATFRRFLPGGEDLLRLVRLTRLYVRDPLEFQIVLRLRAEEVPAFRVAPGDDLPLGHLSWLAPRGDREGRAVVSVAKLDPLRRRRDAVPPPPPGQGPRTSPLTPPKPPSPAARSTPRVATIRRP